MTNNKPYYLYESNNIDSRNLVIVAGSAEGAARFEPYINLLTQNFNVLLIDNPGIGNAPYEEDFTSLSLAFRYQEYIDAVGFKQYNLIGHSFGSFIAQFMAVNKPECVENLVLISSSIGSVNQEQIIQYQLERSDIIKEAGDDKVKLVTCYKSLFGNSISDDFMLEYLEEKSNIPSAVKLSYLINSARHSSYSQVSKIKAKTLIVHGTVDNIVIFDNAVILNNLINDSKVLELEGVGHYPYIEDSSVWALILDFFNGKEVGIKKEYCQMDYDDLLTDANKSFVLAMGKTKYTKVKNLFLEIFLNKDALSIEKRVQKFSDFIS
jgi:pimeloyl-ACP methyl ester carboxylesterase